MRYYVGLPPYTIAESFGGVHVPVNVRTCPLHYLPARLAFPWLLS